MRRLAMALLGAATLSASGAEAATVFTPVVRADPDGPVICYLVNGGTRNVQIARLELIEQFGDVVATRENLTAPPGTAPHEIFVVPRNLGIGDRGFFCRAQFAGSAKSVRLSVCPVVDGSCAGVATAP